MWFAFILVSLKYRKHPLIKIDLSIYVVICFHFSIFEVSETSLMFCQANQKRLWFAFILVSLKYRKHLILLLILFVIVVICFHFSIFEVSETSNKSMKSYHSRLWFAFILVSLKYRKHRLCRCHTSLSCCDLLSF